MNKTLSTVITSVVTNICIHIIPKVYKFIVAKVNPKEVAKSVPTLFEWFFNHRFFPRA